MLIHTAVDPAEYIAGFHALANLGARFYPVNRDKSPAVRGLLNRATSTDPMAIATWVRFKQPAGFAARIHPGSRLLVLDLESPFKHPGEVGPDGMMTLCWRLEELQITLPPCPTVRTGSGGWHLYFVVPRGFRIEGTIELWPGVDILAVGNNVILPGSRTEAGLYREERAFSACAIPELPRDFCKLICAAQKATSAKQRITKPDTPVPTSGELGVDSRTRFRLFRNQSFRTMWHGRKEKGDLTPSAYAFHMAKACLANGLNSSQTLTVILAWRVRRGLGTTASEQRRITKAIIPAAWKGVGAWVEQWHRDQELRLAAKAATSTRGQILHLIDAAGPQTPQSAADKLDPPHRRVKRAMRRMAKAGTLIRNGDVYSR